MSQEADKFFAALNPGVDPGEASVTGSSIPETQLGTRAYHDLGEAAITGQVAQPDWISTSASEPPVLSPMDRLRQMAGEIGDPEQGEHPAFADKGSSETKTELSLNPVETPGADEAVAEPLTAEQTAWQGPRPLSTRARGAALTARGHGRPTAEPSGWITSDPSDHPEA